MIAKNITFLTNGHNLARALTGITFDFGGDELDKTVLASDGGFREYEAGFKNVSVQGSGIFDSDTTSTEKVHEIFLPAYTSGDNQYMACSIGTITVGAPAVMLEGCQMKYDIPIDTGALIFANASWRGNNFNPGKWLMSAQQNEGTTNGTSLDNSASSSNGAYFQGHYENNDATGIVIELQGSTNNSAWSVLGEVVGGTRATGGYTFALNPSDTDTIDLNGVTFNFLDTVVDPTTDIDIKGTLALTMAELAAVLNASTDPDVEIATYTATSTGITVSYDEPGTAGNSYTLDTANGGNSTRTGATLAGGANVGQFGAGSFEIAGTVPRYTRTTAKVYGGDTILVSGAIRRR